MEKVVSFEEMRELLGLSERELDVWLQVWGIKPEYERLSGKHLYSYSDVERFENEGYGKENRLTRREFAKSEGISLASLVNMEQSGKVQPFILEELGKAFYRKEDSLKAKKGLQQEITKYVTAGEVKERLGIKDAVLERLIRLGVLDVEYVTPTRRKMFLKTKVEKLQNSGKLPKDAKGMLTDMDLANQLYVSIGTIYNWVRTGKLIPDKEIITGKRYYNEKTLEQLKKELGDY